MKDLQDPKNSCPFRYGRVPILLNGSSDKYPSAIKAFVMICSDKAWIKQLLIVDHRLQDFRYHFSLSDGWQAEPMPSLHVDDVQRTGSWRSRQVRQKPTDSLVISTASLSAHGKWFVNLVLESSISIYRRQRSRRSNFFLEPINIGLSSTKYVWTGSVLDQQPIAVSSESPLGR